MTEPNHQIAKSKLDPQKEYDALRQEIQKLIEFKNKLLSLQLTVVAAFLGFGFSNKNPMLFLMIPPFVFLLSVVYKNYSYQIHRISYFIKRKFEGAESPLSWETHVYAQVESKNTSVIRGFLQFGITGLFLITPILGFILGLLNRTHSISEIVLFIIDGLSIIGIIILFNYLSSRRMRGNIEELNSKYF